MRINVEHQVVAGRLRFSAPALYRARSLMVRVEEAVRALDPVIEVRGNPLTTRVLVSYRIDQHSQQMIDKIEAALQDILPDQATGKTTARPSESVGRTATARASTKANQKSAAMESRVDSGLLQRHHWHAQDIEDIIKHFKVDISNGLSVAEALKRLQLHGPNAFGQQKIRSDISILLEQFKSLPVAMLGVSAAIAIATGGRADAAVILGVVLINALIGFGTERQAERTIASLGSMAPTHAPVIRDGAQQHIEVVNIVPGDLISLGPGIQVAGDARLVSSRRLTVDESALTGESLPVNKSSDGRFAIDTPLSERGNMLHMGTLVTGGNGHAMVVQTGKDTELGQIQSMVDSTRPPETPMEKQLGRLSTQLGILSGVVCAGIFGIGLLRGQPLLQMLNSAVSLAVAAVPEGLPAVATTTLALGIREMNRHHVAVRKIEAVETLGSVQVLCLDKTGTLTRNHMTVVEVQTMGGIYQVRDGQYFDQQQPVQVNADLCQLMEIVTLCNEASVEGEHPSGSPTEIALLELSAFHRMSKSALLQRYRTLEVRERAEDRPLMSSIHRDGEDGLLLAVKGRPAEVLERCSHKMVNGEILPLDTDDRQLLSIANDRMAGEALRVLAVAFRRDGTAASRSARGLIWLGMVGMQDPLRPGMEELIEHNHRAGIRTVMITGDQSATAYAIAKQLGLADGGSLKILDSSQLDKMDPELLASLVGKVDVFSRVSPAHKLRIVLALQKAGLVVAMTGDGINDGPALKAADIGIAMGASGTDVARSVADIVIDDDNLQTISVAVSQGRTIYANIRKTIHYLLSTNFSEIEVMLAGIVSGLGAPLNPMQLLWINLMTDIFPGLALSFEPPSEDVMERAPRAPDTPMISNQRLGVMAIESGFITLGAMAAFLYGRTSGGPGRGSTLAFHSLTFAQLLHSISSRSERHSLFDRPALPRNIWFERALLGTAAAQMATVFVPPLRNLMGTTPLRMVDGLVIAAGAGLPLLANEVFKVVRRKHGWSVHRGQLQGGMNDVDN